MKFRKRPVIVEAVQWRGDNGHEIYEFVPAGSLQRGEQHQLQVWNSLETQWINVPESHWIIRGTKGEYYPCIDEGGAPLNYEAVEPLTPSDLEG